MRQRGFHLLGAIAVWLIGLSTSGSAQNVDLEAAKKEGKVVVYAAVPPQTMKVINDPFEKKIRHPRGVLARIDNGDSRTGAQ